MPLVKQAIEKLQQAVSTPQYEALSIIGKVECENLFDQLRKGLRLNENSQRAFLEKLSRNANNTVDRDVIPIFQSIFQSILNPQPTKIEVERRFMANIQHSPNLEHLATVIEEYPYDIGEIDKDKLVIRLRALSKDEAQIQEIATQGYRAALGPLSFPGAYGIQDSIISLAKKYASVPKPPALPPLHKKKTVQLKGKPIPPLVSEALASVSKNQPEFKAPHGKIKSPMQDMFIGSSGREASLVSLASYKKLRTLQIKSLMEKGSERHTLQSKFYTPQSHPELGLKYPVFFGDNGELIALMREMPSDTRFELGKGAFGKVYLGMNIDTGKMVAIKVQNPSLQFRGKQLEAKKEEIREEMGTMENVNRLISSIEHGHEIISVDELAGTASYLSLLTDGDSTHPPLRGNNSEEAMVFKMTMALEFLSRVEELHTGKSTAGLEESSRKKYIHGDLKVDNTMFGNGGKLIDFGFALEVPTPPQQFTHFYDEKKNVVSFKGTAIYMSPEIVKNGDFSIQSDIYACAVGLVEIFSAYDIFDLTLEGKDWRQIATEYKATNDPSLLQEYLRNAAPDILNNPNLPEPLRPIVAQLTQMLSYNIDERPPLKEVIAILKSQKEILEFQVFMTKLQNQKETSLSLSKNDLQNPFIKDYIFRLYQEISPELNLINPESIFVVLQAAAKEDNAAVFKNASLHFVTKDKSGNKQSLFALKSRAFQEDLSIIIKDNKSNKVHKILEEGKEVEDIKVNLRVEKAKNLEELMTVMEQIPSMKKATEMLKRIIKDPDKLQRIAKGEQLFPIAPLYNVPQKLTSLAKEAVVKQNKIEASKKQRLEVFLNSDLKTLYQENMGSRKGLWLVNKTRQLGEKVFSPEASFKIQVQTLNDLMSQVAASNLSTDQKGHLAYAVYNIAANKNEEGSPLKKLCVQRLNELREMNSQYTESLPPISDAALNRVVYGIVNEAQKIGDKVAQKPKPPQKPKA